MINLTSTYPGQTFQPVATTQVANQVNTINSSAIPTTQFPMSFIRSNVGIAPDSSGSQMSQVDVLLGNVSLNSFQNMTTARQYALASANQTVNNASYYIENVQPTYYQALVWGAS